jgi:hypothetical protein
MPSMVPRRYDSVGSKVRAMLEELLAVVGRDLADTDPSADLRPGLGVGTPSLE